MAIVNASINRYMRRVLVDSLIGGRQEQKQWHGAAQKQQQICKMMKLNMETIYR